MTEPLEPPPHDGTDQPDVSLDAAAVDRLRALLRDEPVHDDELARERRIRNALAASDPTTPELDAPRPAEVPRPRRASPRPWLVAAAVLAVVGLTGFFIATSGGQRSDDLGAGSADSAEQSATSASEESSPAAGGDPSAPTTTMVPGAADVTSSEVPVLGRFTDVDELRSAVRGGTTLDQQRSPQDEAFTRTDPMLLPCVTQQQAIGAQVVGVAIVGSTPVVAVGSAADLTVLDAATCAPVRP